MNTRNTRIGSVVAAVGLVATMTSCSSGSSADGLTKVTFGYIGDFNGTSLLAIADAKGMWKEHGLSVTTKVFTTGPLQVEALDSGSLDFGYVGPGALWESASGKAPVVMINTFGNADRVVALPGKGIATLADLKGKKVGYPKGTSGEMILRLALEKAGLTMDDVDAVELDPSTMVSALSSGKVDAAGFWYPALSTVKKQVPGLVELAKDSDFSDTMKFPTAFVTQPDMATKNPEELEEVVAVLKEANTYRYEHEDEAIELTAKMNKLSVADVKSDASFDQLISTDDLETATKNGDVDDWLDTFGDYFVTTGTLKEPGDASSYYLSDVFSQAGN